MTGIQLPPSLGQSDLLVKDASPADRYAGTKQVSERYSIIQLGICLFQEDSENPEKIHVVCGSPLVRLIPFHNDPLIHQSIILYKATIQIYHVSTRGLEDI